MAPKYQLWGVIAPRDSIFKNMEVFVRFILLFQVVFSIFTFRNYVTW